MDAYSPATTWQEFFETKSYASYQKAAASAAWIANIKGDEKLLRN
jgi:hypothetical protein